jgi:hypothetical protein
MSKQIGIDLGTSNSSLAFYCEKNKKIEIAKTKQMFSETTTHESETLPSVLLSNKDGSYVVGEHALKQSALTPEKIISSSKSWLCYDQVPRAEQILPWNSSVEKKLSPVDCASHILQHLKTSFAKTYFSKEEEVTAVITVPASFDEIARQLTLKAANQVGFKKVTLLEEPQAAFYAWAYDHEKSWREHINAGDLVLVCDVGGGTTDFSLILVNDKQGELELERISVGDHLLLGGDNIDHTLAYNIKTKLEKDGHSLDQWQYLALVGEVKQAKEKLLSADGPKSMRFGFSGKSNSLFSKKNISTSLSKEEVSKVVLEGFFPLCEYSDKVKAGSTVGLQDFGLQYEQDPAINKHLMAFLQRSAKSILENTDIKNKIDPNIYKFLKEENKLIPSKILFNGGIFKSSLLRKRVMDNLVSCAEKSNITPQELSDCNLDTAVAKGAAYYNHMLSTKEGLRIRAGTSSSFYLGVNAGGLAIPGVEPQINGICVVPEGSEEGVNLDQINKQFGLLTGQSVEFSFFSSKTRSKDEVGTVVVDANKTLQRSGKLAVKIPALKDSGKVVPVRMNARVSEMGTLELGMQHIYSDSKWNLEFNLRAK